MKVVWTWLQHLSISNNSLHLKVLVIMLTKLSVVNYGGYTKGDFRCWSKVQYLKDPFETKMWDSHVRGLGWHFILFYFFISLMFIYFSLLLNTHTMDDHRHKIFVVLVLIITMHQVIGIFFFLAYFAFKKFITLFKFQIWKKNSLQNFIKSSITKVSSKL